MKQWLAALAPWLAPWLAPVLVFAAVAAGVAWRMEADGYDQAAVVAPTGRTNRGPLVAPGGIAMTTQRDRPAIVVADSSGYRTVEIATGRVSQPPFILAVNTASSVAVSDTLMAFSQIRLGSVVVLARGNGHLRAAGRGFDSPSAVAMLDETSILVAEYGSGVITAFDANDADRRRVFAEGLNGPAGLARAPGGGVYVTEALGGTVLKIDADGARRIIARNLRQPEGLAVLPDGRIAVAEVGARRLLIIDPARRGVQEVARGLMIGARFARMAEPLYLPTGVAADENGTIYVACDGDNSLLAFTPKARKPANETKALEPAAGPGAFY